VDAHKKVFFQNIYGICQSGLRQETDRAQFAAARGLFLLLVAKRTPGYARGKKELIAREKADKKKAPY